MQDEDDWDARPVPFIVMKGNEVSASKIEFEVTDEARDVLSRIDSPISVLSVVGMYRTGKSFLLNRILLDRKDGFPVGSTVNACTKGLWIWSKPLRGKTADGSDVNVILIDTEGLGSLNANTQHDCYIFALALLTSSFFLYNSVGTINESALENLSLVVNLTKFIRVGSSVNGKEEDGMEFASYFPKLLWVVRDFTLQLVDQNGRPITSKQYLENALKEVKGFSDKVVEKNRIRNMIKAFFPDRDCYPIVRPVEDERLLQSLSNQGEEVLRENFVKQMKVLRERVFNNSEPKTVQGGQVSGRMLILLSESYVKAVNDGNVPSITDSWSMVCDSECKKILKECVDTFDQVTSSLIEKGDIPMDEERLKEWHSMQKNQLSDLLLARTGSFKGEFQDRYLHALDDSLSDKLKELLKKNAELGQAAIHTMIETIFSDVESSLNGGKYKSWKAFEKDRSEAKEKFLREAPAIGKRDEILLQHLERLFCKAGSLIFEQMVAEREMMERECKRECSEVKHKAKEEVMVLQQEMEEAKLRLMHESRRWEDGREEASRLKELLEAEEQKSRMSEERREESETRMKAAMRDLEAAEEKFEQERVKLQEQLEKKDMEMKRLIAMLEDSQSHHGDTTAAAQQKIRDLTKEREDMMVQLNELTKEREDMMVQLNELESGRAALAPALATLCQELVGVLSELSEAQQQVVELEAEHKDRLLLLDSKMNARDLSKIDEFEEEQVKGGKEEEEEEKEREESCSSSYIANISDSSARAVLQGINVFIQEDQEALDAARKEEATPIAAETSSIRAVSPSPSLLEHMFHDNMLGGAEQRLPEEWITVISRSQGRPYYFNKRTRQSTWTLPGSEKEFGFHSAGNSATSSPTSSPRRGSAACRLGFANGLHPPPLSQKLHSDYPTPPPPRPLLPPVGGLSTLETRLHALEESVNRVLEVPQEERSSCGLIPRDASSFETPRMVKACRVPSSRCTVGAGNKNFTMYEIIVLLSHGGTIPVNHRFSDFVQLHRRLIKLFPHVSLPKVSVELFSSQASRWFNRFDPDLIECRRVWLEQYINELIESPQLETSQPFRSFLFEPSSSASRAGEEATSIAGSQTTMLSNFTSASSRPAG